MDRLSALMSRFELVVNLSPDPNANLQILSKSNDGIPTCLRFGMRGDLNPEKGMTLLLSAQVDWGGDDNPLLSALPAVIHFDVQEDGETKALADVLIAESRAARCGSGSVLNRLCEVLIVRLLRGQIETGGVKAGLLGGLADPRLARAIVAIHDRPEEIWRVETLAREAGLSSSRFAELFRKAVGVTPLAYLRHWRLVLAKQDLSRGDRVQAVAQRYCYNSTEALSRAILHAYGVGPMQIRKSAA